MTLAGGLLLTRQRSITALRVERDVIAGQVRRLTAEHQIATNALAQWEQANTDSESFRRARFAAIRRAIAIIKSQPASPEPLSAPRPPSGPRDNRIFAELLDDPGYAQLCTIVFRQEVEERHGAILARFRSEPEKFAALNRLLVERRLVDLEAENIAVRDGLSSIEQPKARYGASDRLEEEIRALTGDALYKQLK